MAQLFPDVVSVVLPYDSASASSTWTAPAQYAFVMVQVRKGLVSSAPEDFSIKTSHGVIKSGMPFNLILKGGDTFTAYSNNINITALCHRRPT